MTDFEVVHARLRAIILAHRGDRVVTRDGPRGIALEALTAGVYLADRTPPLDPQPRRTSLTDGAPPLDARH